MKNIYLTTGTINEVFNEMETSFKGNLNSNNDEFNLTLNSDLIKGNIDGISFINGITSIQVNISFSDDTMLSIESSNKTSLLFAYCTEGSINHSFGVSGPISTLKNHQSAVMTSSRSINTILHFKKNIPVKFSLIKVEIEHSVNNPILSRLKKTFFNKQQNYSYQGIQNLKIMKEFDQFNSVTEQGMTGHIMKKEIIQSILTIEIDDHTDNLIKIARAIKRSALHQMNELKEISTSIKHYSFEAIYSKVITSKKQNLY